jgi:hypothetical protein
MRSAGCCHLVSALSPEGVSACDANDGLSACPADDARGLAVGHDHVVAANRVALGLDARSDQQRIRLDDSGPRAGWHIAAHPLTFSLTGAGFAAQTSLTLAHHDGTSLERLAIAEPDDPRY